MLRVFACKQIAAVAAVLLVMSVVSTAFCETSSTPVFNNVEQSIIGRNNKGPYTLDWVNIDTDSIVVVVNGRILRKDSDYKVDSANGLIAFDSNVLEDVIVHVSYKIINGKSKKNTSITNTPISLNLFNTNKGSISLIGLRVQDSTSASADSTVIGLNGEKSWSGTKLTSQFLMSQADNSNSSSEGNSMDRSLVKLGGETNIGLLKFTGSVTDVGEKFTGEKQYGVKAGNQAMNLGVVFAPVGSSFQGSATMNTSKDTDAGSTSTVSEQKLAYNNNDLKAAITHTATDTAAATAGSETSVDTTNMTVNKQIGKTTSASMSIQDKAVASAGNTDNTSSQELAVSSSAIKNTTVQTKVTNIDSDSGGKQVSTTTTVTTKPVEQVALTATHSTTDTETNTADNTSVNVKVNPIKNLELQSSLSAQNTADNQAYQRNVSLASAPAKYVKFSASFAQNGVNENDDVTKAAAIELTPLSTMKFTTGYKINESGSQVLTIRDYSASAKPWKFFSANGSYRDRDMKESPIQDTKAFDVALSPFNYFSFTAAYQSNPETTAGVMQNFNSTTAGVILKVGTVGVTANFTNKDEYLDNRQSEERKLAFDLPAFGSGRINTGYKMARLLSGSEVTSNTYSLGYSQNVSSLFNISFTGYYTHYLQGDVSLGNEDQYSAEANFGFKF